MEHIVLADETLSGIAAEHGVRLEDLVSLNKFLNDPDFLQVGDRLRLPRQSLLAESTSTWHVLLGVPADSAPPWKPRPIALSERVEERQEVAQSALEAASSERGTVWRAMYPLRALAGSAARAYAVAAHATDSADYSIVADGGTLYEHAEAAGFTIRDLQRGNRLTSDVLLVGQKLRYASREAPGPLTLLRIARQCWQMLTLPVRLGPPLGPAAGAYVLSGFGLRRGRIHEGIDLASEMGEPILAAADGLVTFSGVDGAFGLRIDISHAGGLSTSYAHCSSLLRAPGERVARGDEVAAVGETGRCKGPHLHFEVRRYGQPLDPAWVTSLL